jgi:hypothetical protein
MLGVGAAFDFLGRRGALPVRVHHAIEQWQSSDPDIAAVLP